MFKYTCLQICYGDEVGGVFPGVDDDIKKKMQELPHINWSDYIGQAIMSKIREEEMRKACETMDRLAEKTSGRWSGTEEIRRWREMRYGRSEK